MQRCDLSTLLAGKLRKPEIVSARSLKEMMETVERVLLSRALRENANNKTRTAELLGITREGLAEFIRGLAIPEAEKERLLQLTPAGYIGKAAELARKL